jgi:hypothetical protein
MQTLRPNPTYERPHLPLVITELAQYLRLRDTRYAIII